MNFTCEVDSQESGIRLDAFLQKKLPEYSRTYLQSLMEKQLVFVNTKLAKKSCIVMPGDAIELTLAKTEMPLLQAENIPLDIIYEDPYLLAINKPVGMVVHPAVGNWSNTFANALVYHCKELDGLESLRPGIVHRLDKDTSGVLLAAKDERVKEQLVSLFANRQIYKEYWAITVGSAGMREIKLPIGRHPIRRKEMCIREVGGKHAHTTCETLKCNEQLALVKLVPHTGRTHQLRVHLQSVGAPILGDQVYGSTVANARFNAKRQMLHAYILRFCHPITKEEVELKAPFPQDINKFINILDTSHARANPKSKRS